MRRLSSARSRLFRSFRSLSKLRLEEEGRELNHSKSSQQGKQRGLLKSSTLSSTQSSPHQLRTKSTVSVVEDVSISKLKTILGAYFSQ